MDTDRVPHAEGGGTDVGEREGLPAEDEGRDVVPAGEILGRHDGVATRGEDPPGLGDEVIGVPYVFDDLVGAHDVESLVVVGKRVVEVSLPDVDASRSCESGAVGLSFYPMDVGGLGRRCELEGASSVVTTEVDKPIS